MSSGAGCGSTSPLRLDRLGYLCFGVCDLPALNFPRLSTSYCFGISGIFAASPFSCRASLSFISAPRPQPFVFDYEPEDGAFHLRLHFRKSHVSTEELAAALRTILRRLESGSFSSSAA